MSQLGEQEYAELLQEAHPKLWVVASAIVSDRTQADDIVQDAAITGWKKIADFEIGTNFTAWMSQIVRFTALNYLKTRKSRKTVSLDLHIEEDTTVVSPDADQGVISPTGQLIEGQQEFDDQVTNAISQLEPDRRACLLLRVVHGMSYEEIAAVVDLPEGTAMSHVHRAKAALRRLLSTTSSESPQEQEES